MNPIKKLRLKTLLRNCDYVIAGKVIKQQYYDINKGTEINRLIDQFMANPGFEEALKLIEYNDMMVFYFTESCKDGLYLRKSSNEPAKIIPPQAQAPLSQVKETYASFEAAIEDAAISLEEPFSALRELKSADIAEEQMKQQITGNWKIPKTISRAEQAQMDSIPIKSEVEVDEEISLAIEAIEEQPTSLPASLQPSVSTAAPVAPTLKRPDFANVIATLQLDIHTMSKDLEDYRRQLAFFPGNEKQLKEWIRSLEEAIHEFSQAIDYLEGEA